MITIESRVSAYDSRLSRVHEKKPVLKEYSSGCDVVKAEYLFNINLKATAGILWEVPQ